MKNCPSCGKEIDNRAEKCRDCGHKDLMSVLKFSGFVILFYVAMICGDIALNHAYYDKFTIHKTSSDTLTLCWILFIASSLVLLKLFIDALPRIIPIVGGLLKFFGWLLVIGAVIFGIFSLFSGIAAMSTTTFLLLIIIWQLDAIQNKKEG